MTGIGIGFTSLNGYSKNGNFKLKKSSRVARELKNPHLAHHPAHLTKARTVEGKDSLRMLGIDFYFSCVSRFVILIPRVHFSHLTLFCMA